MGQIKTIKTPQSISLVKVNKVIGGQNRVQLAVINYTVEPSEATRNSVYNRANAFARAAQGSVENFNKAVNDSALIARPTTIFPSQRAIQGLQDSRSLVSWAYNLADEEKVSKVESFGDTFVVAALTDAAQKGYQPFEKVKEQIRPLVVNQKKGEILSAKFAEMKSLSAIAAAYGDTVQTARDINFSSFIVPSVGAEPALIGAVCACLRFDLGRVNTSETHYRLGNRALLQRLTAENQQTAFARSYQAFLDMLDIKDTRYKLF